MLLHAPSYRHPYSHHIDASRNGPSGSKTPSPVGNASWHSATPPHQLNSSFRFAVFFFFLFFPQSPLTFSQISGIELIHRAYADNQLRLSCQWHSTMVALL